MPDILVILDQPPTSKPIIQSDSTTIKAVFAGDIQEQNQNFQHLRGYRFDVIMVPKTITPDVPCYTYMKNYVSRLQQSRRNVQVLEYEDSYQ